MSLEQSTMKLSIRANTFWKVLISQLKKRGHTNVVPIFENLKYSQTNFVLQVFLKFSLISDLQQFEHDLLFFFNCFFLIKC